MPTGTAGGDYSPTYSAYLNSFNSANSYVADDSGRMSVNGTPLTQDAYAALTPAQRWSSYGTAENINGSAIYGLDQSDPRYAALAKQTGAEAGRLFIGNGAIPFSGNSSYWNDPSKVIDLGNGTYAFAENNQTPAWQHTMHPSSKMPTWAGIMLAAMGGAAGLAAAGADTVGAGLDAAAAANPGALAAGATNLGATGIGTGIAGDVTGAGVGTSMAASGLTGTASLGSGTGTSLESLGIDASPISVTPLNSVPGMVSSDSLFGGGGLLSSLNTARSGLGLVRALTGGGGGGGSTGGGNMGALGSIMSLLGLGALGRQGGLFGGGIGTPGGAQGVADKASNLADPWGASGLRTQAQQALTPGTMMQLLGLNPGGTASDITKDPAYQFALTQGTNAINVGDAAQGTLRSGNRLTELQNYGTGLAAQYENQYRTQNLASLGALSNMAGLGSSSPTAAAASQISGFEGATSLQNSGLNGLFGSLLGGGGQGGGLGGIMSLLGSAGSGISSFFSSLFGDNSGLSDSAITDLISGIGGGTTSDALFGGASDLGGAFGDAFAGV